MKIHGREVGMLKSVGAVCELTEMCPERKLNNITMLVQGDEIDVMKNIIKIVCILSKAYEDNKRFEDPDYKPNPLTEEECMLIDDADLTKLYEKAIETIYAVNRTVEVEKHKKKEEINELGNNVKALFTISYPLELFFTLTPVCSPISSNVNS